MLMKDKDILSENNSTEGNGQKKAVVRRIDKKNMRQAWGDAFDYYIRGVTEKYLYFHGRATRLEFFGFMVACWILFFVVYFLGVYIDVPLLGYYYLGATIIPLVGVWVRRFHDINKKALFFMLIGAVSLVSPLFLGWFSILLIGTWYVGVSKLLLRESLDEESIFGTRNENDEIYGEDNKLIIRKFFVLSISLAMLFLVMTGLRFDNWKRQNEQRLAIIKIDEQVSELGEQHNLSKVDIQKAQKEVRSILKKMEGKFISNEDIEALVEKTVLSFDKK